MSKKLITFLDSAQRTIIAEEKEVTADALVVLNPVVVNIVPQQTTGQMALQLLPVFFREFQADKTSSVTFSYNRDLVTIIEVEGGYDFRLDAQYEQIFNPPQVATAPDANAPPAIHAPPAAAPAPPALELFEEN